MNFEKDDNRLVKAFIVFSVLILLIFTAFDILNIFPVVSDALKLSGTVLCCLFSMSLLFLLGVEFDRVVLMLSLLFAVAADALLIFTDLYFYGVLAFCVVQELHSIRIFSIKKYIVRMDGRIVSKYLNYKVWKGIAVMNLLQLLLAAVPILLSLVWEMKDAALFSACIFYAVGFIGNLIHLSAISKDVRLLDDMRPLRCYFVGMLLYFICDLVLVVFRLPEYLPVLQELSAYVKYALLVIWPLYLIGLICISLSGNRRQNFYT